MGINFMDVETAMEYVGDLEESNYLFQDLQLAAELGKTLLERNKELETSLKQHQNVIEEQTQEIEYLTKQTAALREVNDSRLRIYEQLEVSIQELEHTNQKLSVDNISDKKLIKTLTAQIESLDLRCEELQKSMDEMAVAQESARRRQRRSVCTPDTPQAPPPAPAPAPALPPCGGDEDEVLQLLQQIQELRSQRAREQRKANDLEDQLTQLIQENACLEERVAVLQQKEEEMQSLQEELSTLEEIRQGHLCRRCLRGQDGGTLTADEDDDDVSIIDSLVDESQRKSVLMQLQEKGDIWKCIWLLITSPKLILLLLAAFCAHIWDCYVVPLLMLPITLPLFLIRSVVCGLSWRCSRS
uniref:Uncharacterized protein n=1 Tax=Cuerna arida TaxID=1464854 RepID=A0A1B6FD44_9HEMI